MAVGAARPDQAEIEGTIWKNAKVYVDSMAGAKKESGDMIFSGCDIESELGSLISGGKKQPWSNNNQQRTMFKSLGLAIQDLVAVKMVYDNVGKSKHNIELKPVNKDIAATGNGLSALSTAKTGVTNLQCEAKLVTDQVLVCEMSTSSSNVSMLFKAETGQLKTILDGSELKGLDDNAKNAFYVQAYEKVKDQQSFY